MRWIRFLILPVALLSSCVADFLNDLDNIGSPYWNPELAVPIISGEFTIEDYVDALSTDISVSQDADGVVVFEYVGPDIASDLAEDMIDIPDQEFNSSINFGNAEAGGFPFSQTLTKSQNFGFTIDTEDADLLDSMIFKTGILNINIGGDFPVSGELEVVFNTLQVNGAPLTKTYSWSYNPANPTLLIEESVDLSGAFVDYTRNGTTSNDFNFDINLKINYQGQAITSANAIAINLTMINPGFRIVYGKFAQRQFETPKTSVLLGILEKVEAIDFFLDNPQIEFNFKSSFGLPVVAKLKSLSAINSKGDSLAFTGAIITDNTQVASPTIANVGSFLETSITIDRENSNITDIISFLPAELAYQFEGTVDSQSPLIEQFVLDTSQVIGSYKVKLPLSGRVNNFSTTKEFDFTGEDLDLLKKTKIILHTTNGLPITIGVKLIFFDEAGIALDTLFADTNILSSGVLDSNGLVIEPTENFVEAQMTAEEMKVLTKANKIVLESILFTGETGAENVKIKMGDKVKISLYIQTAINF
jgi:hypothetical protein